MTWTPVPELVTGWAPRCGTTRGGRCTALVRTDLAGELSGDPEDIHTAPWTDPALTDGNRAVVRHGGWLVLRAGRVVCPPHGAAAEYLVRAALDGLPFGDTWPTGPGQDDR